MLEERLMFGADKSNLMGSETLVIDGCNETPRFLQKTFCRMPNTGDICEQSQKMSRADGETVAANKEFVGRHRRDD
jgi:hypothetical protein